MPFKELILDGEMIAPEPDGRPNFHEMHFRMVWNAEQLAFVAFDILYKNGEDLRSRPTIERKEILWDVVKPAKGIIQYSEDVEGGGAEFYAAVQEMGLEGMVSKRRGGRYLSGPSDSWVKTKCWEVGDFELMGIKSEPGKQTTAFVARDGKYAGSATITLTKQLRDRLWQWIQKAKADKPVGVPKGRG
ncbi:hypothetical protein NKI38_04505 [Mesorhizobium sp. M0621]|uniref:ATP-dependent DNA ligase n=1 Tax=Mesorhizobium sp. M0621 TaxID=2956974 RepID=UPI00333D3E04